MINQILGGLRRLQKHFRKHGSALVANQSGNVFTMLFGAVALTGVLAGVGMQTITGPVTTITRVTQKNITDTHLLTNASIVIASAIDGDFDNDGVIEPAEYLASGSGDCGTTITGGGCLPTTLGATRTDPWGTMYAYCVWDHGTTIDARNDAGTGSTLERLQGSATAIETRPVIAIVSAGPNKTFETSCAAYDSSGDEGVVEVAGSDDFVYTRTYAEASASGGGLWQLKATDSDVATIEKDLEIGTGANQVSVDSATGIGNFIGLSTNSIAAKDADTVDIEGGLLLDAKSSYTTCSGTEEGALRINDDTSGDPILEICDGAGVWNPISGKGTTIDDDEDTFMLVDDGSGGDNDLIRFYAGDANIVRMTISNDGSVSMGGTLGVTGDATVGGTFGVTGATTLSSTLDAGASTLDSLTVTNAATVGTTLGVTGVTTLSDAATVGGTLGVTGATTLSSTLGVTGATTLSSTLGVTGDATMNANAIVVGDLTVDTDTLFVDSTNDRVGIGTVTPGHKFHVVGGDAVIETDGAAELNVVSTDGAGDAVLGLEVNGSTWQIINDTSNSNELQVSFNNSVAMTVETNGKVGIGTSSPDALLDVDGGLKIGNHVTCAVGGGNNGTMRFNATDDIMQICVDGVWQGVSSIEALNDIGDVNAPSPAGDEVLAWDGVNNEWIAKAVGTLGGGSGLGGKWDESGSDIYYDSGNVGIGTDTPLADALSVLGDAVIREDDNGNTAVRLSADNTNGIITVLEGGGVNTRITGDSGAATYFNAGDVGIGTTTPAARLEVAGGIKIGTDSDSCTGTKAGTIRYNTVSNKAELCDGTNWLEVGAGAGGGSSTLSALTDTDIGAPLDRQVLTYDSASGDWIATNQLGASNVVVDIEIVGASVVQTFNTQGVSGAGVETFVINGTRYLFFAEGNNGSTSNFAKTLYKKASGDTQFTVHQVFNTPADGTWDGFYDVEHVQIGSDHFLMMSEIDANNGPSQLYKWNSSTELFDQHQAITGHRVHEASFFQLGSDTYLIMPNYYDGDYTVDTQILRYNSSTEQFDPFQTITPIGANASSAEFFTIGSDHYLVIATHYDGDNIVSNGLYQWNGTNFDTTPIQTFTDPRGTIDVEVAQFDGKTFLVFASYHNLGWSNTQYFYEWNSATSQFDQLQTFGSTGGAYDFDYWKIQGAHFLVQTDYYRTSHNTAHTRFYKWNDRTQLWDLHYTFNSGNSSHGGAFYEEDNQYFWIQGEHYDGNYQTTSDIWLLDTNITNVTVEQGVVTTGIPTCNPGQVLTGSYGTFQCVTGGGGAGGSTVDGDGDTKVQVEESADEDKIRFDTANVERMIIDENGNIGIGTSDPRSVLHVIGGVQISDDASACNANKAGTIRYVGGNLQLCNSSNTWQTIATGTSGSNTVNYMMLSMSGATQTSVTAGTVVAFDTVEASNGSDITHSGNQFTLTAGKHYKIESTLRFLQAAASTAVIDYTIFDVTNGASATGVQVGSADVAGQYTEVPSNAIVNPSVDTTYEVRIQGVGGASLDILGGAYSRVIITELNASTGSGSGSGGGALVIDADSDTRINVEESPDEDMIRFDTAGDERVIITDTGTVGIGTSTPQAQLDVVGGVRLGDDSAACTTANEGTMRFNDSKLQICVNELWTDVGVNAGGDGFETLPAPGIGDASWPDVIRCVVDSNGDMRFYHLRYRDSNSRYHYTSLSGNEQLSYNGDRTFFSSNSATDCDNRDVATMTTLGRTHLYVGGPESQIETGWPDVIECLHSNTHTYLFYYYYKNSTDTRYYRRPGSSAYMQYDSNGAFNTSSTNDYTSCEGKPINQIVGDGQGYDIVGGTGSGSILDDNVPDVISCVNNNGNTHLFYSHQYENDGAGTYHYYGDMHTGSNYIRFFNATQRLDSSYNFGASSDCKNMSYQELYAAGKAFDILNDDGGALGGVPQPGDLNTTGDGYFVTGWPDALKCSTAAHPNIVLSRGSIGTSTTTYYSTQANSFSLTFNTVDLSFNSNNSNMNGSDCVGKPISQLETENLAIAYRNAATDPAQSIWNGTYPDAIVCTKSNGDVEISWFAYANVNHVHYGRSYDSSYFRWNVSDGTYSTQSSMHAGTSCENKTIAQLMADGIGFNLVGGADTGSMIAGLPDAVMCKDTVDGHERPFYLGHISSSGAYAYYYDRHGYYYGYYKSNGNYYTTNDSGYDCMSKSLSQLKTDGRALYLAETGNIDVREEADHDGGSSMVPGWPDAIVCIEQDGDPWVFWHNYHSGSTIYYDSMTINDTEYRVRFNANGSYQGRDGIGEMNCTNRSMTELLNYGQAFNLLGGGGISVRAMLDTDGDTMVQIEESADEDFIRFDTAGLERVIISDTGNVGIGTPAPAALLDVAGAIKLGDDGLVCAAGTEGAMRYETNNDTVEVCDGTNWIGMGGSGATSLVELTDTDITGTPSGGQVLTYNDTAGLWEAATYAAGGSIFTTQMDIVSIDNIQGIGTHGAEDWEHFEIDGEHFLAIANYHDGGWNDVPQRIYKWDGTQFNQIWQATDRGGVRDWEYMQLGSKHYLMMMEIYEGNYESTIQHELFEWNGSSFTQVQTFDLKAGQDAEHISIGGEDYVFMGICRDDSTHNVDAKLYKWNTGTEQFDFHQNIPAQCVRDAEDFTIAGTDYLFVANNYDDSSYNLTSRLYEWDAAANSGNGGYVEVVGAGIATNAPQDVEYFSFGGNHYIAIADHYNGSSSTIPIRIYQWNGSSFTLIQDDMTYTNSYNLAYFEMGSDHYLVSANYHTSPDIAIHKWNGSQFQLIETIDRGSERIYGIEHFEINGVHYLADANYYNSNYNRTSNIWRLNTVVRSFEVTSGVAPSLVPTCTAGQVATADGTTFTCVDVDTDTIADTDGNTQIQVEEAANEDKIRFDTAGVERVIIDDAGNVGIGTTNPAVDLDVEGGVQFGDVVAACDSTLHGTIRYNGGAMQLCDSSDTWVGVAGGGGVGASMVNGWPDAIRCDFAPNTEGIAILYLDNAPWAGDGSYYYKPIDYDIAAGNQFVRFLPNGNFASQNYGIASNCDNKTIAQLYADGQAFNFVGGGSGGSGGATEDADSDTRIQVEESADEDMIRFDTANNERMIITDTGLVGIGTSDPQTMLDVTGGLRIGDDSAACTTTNEGVMRYNANKLQICTNEQWTDVGLNAGDGDSYSLIDPPTIGDPSWPDVMRCNDDSNGVERFFYFEYRSNTTGRYRYNEPGSDYYIEFNADETYRQASRATDCKTLSIDDLNAIGRTHQFIGGSQSQMIAGWPDVVRCQDGSNHIHIFYQYHQGTSNHRYYRLPGSTAYMQFNSDGTFNTGSTDGYTNCEGKSIAQLSGETVPLDGGPVTYNIVGGDGAGSMLGTGIPDVVVCTDNDGNATAYYSHQYETTGTYHYYAAMRNDANRIIRFFNATQRYDEGYGPTASDCDGRSYSDLYADGQAFDLVNNVGGPMTGTLLDGEVNDAATGYMIKGWPDFLTCEDTNGYEYVFGRGTISSVGVVRYNTRYSNSFWLEYNADKTHANNHTTLNGANCDNLTIAQMEAAGLAHAINDGSGSATSMVSGWPDAITCNDTNSTSGNKYQHYYAYENASHVFYGDHYGGNYIRYNKGDQSWSTSNANYGDCQGRSISALQVDGQTHNIIGGTKDGSLVPGWPDAILCRDLVEGHTRAFYHAHQNASPYAYYYDYNSHYIGFYRDYKTYYTTNDSNYDCINQSIDQLVANGLTRNFIDSGNETQQEPAQHSGGGSIVDGWPDAIVCYENADGDPWVFWYAFESGSSYVRYIAMVYSTTYYYLDFQLNKEWEDYGGIGANNCVGRSISELQSFGQAFDVLGGGGISVRNMTDQDGDTQIHVEKTADDDTLRFDTVGLERMVITDTGHVGIGTATPVTKLEIDGGLRIGDDAGTCNSGYSGTMRYTDANGLQICDGLLWTGVGSGTVINALNDITDVDAGAPNDRQVLAWNATDGEWEAKDILNGGIIEYTQSISGVTQIQSDIATHWGYEAETFVINNETYLMFANSYDGNASDVPQYVYKWNGAKFVQHQLLDRDPGQSGSDFGRVRAIETFEAGGNHYMIMVEYEGEDDNHTSARSFLFKWNITTEQFDLTQTIGIPGVLQVKAFVIAGDTYVAFSSHYNGTSYALGSPIYQFNSGTEQLGLHQTINTVGTSGVDFFTIGSDHYLAYASYYNGSNHVSDSQIHKWNSVSGEFDNTPMQLLNMNGAYDVEYTSIDGEHYLVFPQLQGDEIEVWQWNGANWISVQNITGSQQAYNIDLFSINNTHFMMANDYGSGGTESDLYQWMGSGYERIIENFGENYALGGTYIQIDGLDYVAVTRHYNGSTGNVSSYLYRLDSYISSFRVVPTVAQAIIPTCAAGQVLTGTVSGMVCVTGGQNLSDGDGDTKIQVDEGNLDDDIIRFDTDGQERMVIRADGKIGIGTANPTYEMEVIGTVRADDVLYTSDRRYKENIETLDATHGLSKVESLNPVRFNWKDKDRDQRDHLGLIAQEVEEVLPELVGGTDEKKAVDYMGLVPVLIKAIQEQQVQIEQLNKKIEMMQNQNSDTMSIQETP